MVKLSLTIQADLQGVTDLSPVDTDADPFVYSFTIECTSCREPNPKPVGISRQELVPISGSRGEANLIWKCKSCKVRIVQVHNHATNNVRESILQVSDDTCLEITHLPFFL